MSNNCLQTRPSQGFNMINVNGSESPTQCTTTTIEIYSSMSKECLISVLLNKQSGRWSRQSGAFAPLLRITGGSVSMARCHGFPRVTRLFLTCQGHRELEFGRRQPTGTGARCRTCACAYTLPTSAVPGRAGSSQLLISAPTGPKALIGMID